MLNTSLTLAFKDFISKSKFRQFGAKIKISLDLLENTYTSQFESAEYEFDCFYFQQKNTSNIRQV